jgi:hypothetical protein
MRTLSAEGIIMEGLGYLRFDAGEVSAARSAAPTSAAPT